MYTYVFKYFLDYSQNKKFIAPTYIVLSPIVKINYILIFYLKKDFPWHICLLHRQMHQFFYSTMIKLPFGIYCQIE